MATTSIKNLIESCKRKASVTKWIEEQKVLARECAYKRRNTIYKRELENEIKRLDYVLPLWERFKKLIQKSSDYDALIEIDRQGYITIQLVFPITQDELSLAQENRRNYIANNKEFGNLCCRLPEEVWKVSHERVNKVFKDMTLSDHGSYCNYGSNPLLRWVDFVKC